MYDGDGWCSRCDEVADAFAVEHFGAKNAGDKIGVNFINYNRFNRYIHSI